MKREKPMSVQRIITALAFGWVVVCAGAAVLAPVVCGYDPAAIDIGNILQPPSAAHWLGTDQLGRDVLARLVYGARVSLIVGFVSVGISVTLGVLVGLAAGYFGGWTDRALSGAIDLMLCFPTFFLILAVVAAVDKPGIWPILVILGLTGWMGTARLVRAEVMSLREREYVMAARVIGASELRVLFRHILPNALSPVWVSATLGVAGAILTESGLSFLGIGVQPPSPSWGNMLGDGRLTIGAAWWMAFFPGTAILFTVLAYNYLGESLKNRMEDRR
jgi:peptide/nickel transport system permease protein